MILELFASGQLMMRPPEPRQDRLINLKPHLQIQAEPIQPLEAPTIQKIDKIAYIVETPVKTPVRGSKAPSGWYPYGQCTYWVWTKRVVPGWNDASDWLWQARRDGWTISSKPIVGAIAWEPGHVAYVESVKGSSVTVSEMNYKGLGVVSRRTVPISTFQYIY